MMRNLGGAIGTAAIETFFTKREQFHSAIITPEVSLLEPATRSRLAELQQYFMSHGFPDPAGALRVSRGENCTLAVEKRLTPTIAWLANLRVKVAADGSDHDRRGCRPADRPADHPGPEIFLDLLNRRWGAQL
jgi:hypothetical protein